jgi:CopG family nickel-responsive transcriptional regulator
MTYDHHKRELVNSLLDLQHDFQEIIISAQHVHLSHKVCLEIIAVRGRAAIVEKLAFSIKSMVGVRQVSIGVAAEE